jgi:hypothetical protein
MDESSSSRGWAFSSRSGPGEYPSDHFTPQLLTFTRYAFPPLVRLPTSHLTLCVTKTNPCPAKQEHQSRHALVPEPDCQLQHHCSYGYTSCPRNCWSNVRPHWPSQNLCEFALHRRHPNCTSWHCPQRYGIVFHPFLRWHSRRNLCALPGLDDRLL